MSLGRNWCWIGPYRHPIAARSRVSIWAPVGRVAAITGKVAADRFASYQDFSDAR